MEDRPHVKPFNDQFVPRRSSTARKEKPFRTKKYLDFLSHYDAQLVQNGGPIMVVRCKTGDELPLEQKAKLLMVKLLLDEFGTVYRTNEAVRNYKTSRP